MAVVAQAAQQTRERTAPTDVVRSRFRFSPLQDQFRLSLLLLAVLCFTTMGVGLLAHLSPIMARHLAQERERHRNMNGVYAFTSGYLDFGEYVLIGQVPQDDHSRGGVYFLGASDTMISIMPWELPPAERRLIRNYAIADLSHREARHFLRSLIEEHNLLQAGGEHVTVILGLSYHMAREKLDTNAADQYVPLLFRRDAFYTFETGEGIHRVPMSSVERFLRREYVYTKRFLRATVGASRVLPPKRHDAAKYQQLYVKIMGPNWQNEIKEQMQDLARLFDFLQERKVRVRVIFPPHGSWQDGLPFTAAYRDMLRPILESRNIPVADLSDLLPDEEFGDPIHFRYSGQWTVHRVYRDVALQALAEMGTTLAP